MKKKEEFLYDVRIVQRHLREGSITKKEYDKYINSLPDMESNSEPLIIEDESEIAAQESEESVVQEPEESEEEETE